MITEDMRKYKNHIKYRVDNFDILFGNGDIEKMNGDMVTHLYIERDFDELFFPVVNISIMMRDELYHRIKQENDTVKFRMRLIKNIYDKDNTFLKYEICFNEVFVCFKDKENVIEDNEALASKKRGEGEDSVTLGSNVRDFYLFTDEIMKCKKVLNLSVESANMTDLLLYIFMQAGINKLLMSKLNSNPSISGFTIPTGNIVDTITYLNNQKPFYEKGMQLFFDVDLAFLIDKNYKCTSWRKNEVRITHLHVANMESGDSQLNGYYVDKDRKQTHVFINTGRIQIRNTNISSNQLNGHNIKIINPKANSTSTINPKTTTVGSNNERLLTLKEGNSYTVSDLKTRIEENECICGITIIGVDTDLLTPNKEVIITYEDPKLNSKYGGNYRISKVTNILTKDATELVGEIQAVFKKQ